MRPIFFIIQRFIHFLSGRYPPTWRKPDCLMASQAGVHTCAPLPGVDCVYVATKWLFSLVWRKSPASGGTSCDLCLEVSLKGVNLLYIKYIVGSLVQVKNLNHDKVITNIISINLTLINQIMHIIPTLLRY